MKTPLLILLLALRQLCFKRVFTGITNDDELKFVTGSSKNGVDSEIHLSADSAEINYLAEWLSWTISA